VVALSAGTVMKVGDVSVDRYIAFCLWHTVKKELSSVVDSGQRLPWIVTLPCTHPLMVVLGETSALQGVRNTCSQREKSKEEDHQKREVAPELSFLADSRWTVGEPQHAERVH
jgi:hypothetical protein